MQSPDAAVRGFTRGCILRRCAQLAQLQALLVHLLAAEEAPCLPIAPLSVAAEWAGTGKRRNPTAWVGQDAPDESGEDADGESGGGSLCKSQQRAVKVFRCDPYSDLELNGSGHETPTRTSSELVINADVRSRCSGMHPRSLCCCAPRVGSECCNKEIRAQGVQPHSATQAQQPARAH